MRLLKLIAGPDYEPGSTGAEHHLGITPKATVKPDYWVEGFLAEDIALARPICREMEPEAESGVRLVD